MLTTHICAGLLHPRSILFSGLVIDDCFSNACKELHLDVKQTEGSKSKGAEMQDSYGTNSVWAVYEVYL